MAKAVRIGDANSRGGLAVGRGAANVKINGRPACLPGARVTPHPCFPRPRCKIHGRAKTRGGSRTVKANGRPIIRVGDNDTCGHRRATGSRNVNIGR
jgi:uncharacterized Zn-binding protein involved in type VI secretion